MQQTIRVIFIPSLLSAVYEQCIYMLRNTMKPMELKVVVEGGDVKVISATMLAIKVCSKF